MKLISWNVNGIRAVLKKGFVQSVKKMGPDVLALQETKASHKVPVEVPLPGYEAFWNHAEKPGRHGTAVLTKIKPLSVRRGMGRAKHDNEGRILTLEFKKYYLVDVYVPNSRRNLERLPYRTKQWDPDFRRFLKSLEEKKPVIFCGDLNVAHRETDLANPKANAKNHGFTPQERAGFDKLIEAGFLDSFRMFHEGGGHYTWWSQLNNCRARNIGWRLDYFLVSKSLEKKVQDAFILPRITGSDHCPVGLVI